MQDDIFWSSVPVFAISGFSGAGKTTLIEQLVPPLLEKGLALAVVKHDVHGVQIDRPGKDSERIFRAGADLLLHGADEFFIRRHDGGEQSLQQILHSLSQRYDLILVEGHKETPLPKVWLLGEGESTPPAGKKNILASLRRDEPRLERTLALIEAWLPECWRQRPVYGCVLIGGRSSRMGRPKHLLEQHGRTWLERTLACVAPLVEEVVIAGRGEVPAHLAHYPRLPDIPAVRGPMAGMVAAMRWAPHCSWLVCACDMPQLSAEALQWLLAQRQAGVWATLPDLRGEGYVEPLLAHYDPRAGALLEGLLARHCYSPSALATHPKIRRATPPAHLLKAWRNVNSEAELVAYQQLAD